VRDGVFHPTYGQGRIVKDRHKGYLVLVEFEDGIARWVRGRILRDLKPEISPPEVSVPQPQAIEAGGKAPPGADFRQRRIVEAFRLGVVPPDCVEDFTFGREWEVEAIREWLNDPDDSTLFLVGGYGTGKTHLLHYAASRALGEGFAVAVIEVDPNETSFDKPKRLYHRFTRTFAFLSPKDGKRRGFRDFLRHCISSNPRVLRRHAYFKPLLDNQEDELVWAWIEGAPLGAKPPSYVDAAGVFHCYWSLPSLYTYSKAANIYCYLLSSLGWLAVHELGLKGLLLVFDEAENVDMASTIYRWERAHNFLVALIRVASNDSRMSMPARHLPFDHPKRAKGIPYLFKVPSGLKLLFAFAEAPEIHGEFPEPRQIRLDPVSDSALREAFEALYTLYDEAYNMRLAGLAPDMVFNHIADGPGRTRSFIKATVEALDLLRLHPEKKATEILR